MSPAYEHGRRQPRSGAGLSLLMALAALFLFAAGVVFLIGETEVIRADRARPSSDGEVARPLPGLAALPPALVRREAITEFAGPCLRGHEEALSAGDGETALDTLYICAAILGEGLKRAPQSGSDWAVLGLALQRAGDGRDTVEHAYRMAARLAPRRQDVALSRVVMALRMGDAAPADIRERLRADLAMLTDLRFVSELLARQYVAHPEIRDRMLTEIEGLDAVRQDNFVRTLRRVTRGEGEIRPD